MFLFKLQRKFLQRVPVYLTVSDSHCRLDRQCGTCVGFLTNGKISHYFDDTSFRKGQFLLTLRYQIIIRKSRLFRKRQFTTLTTVITMLRLKQLRFRNDEDSRVDTCNFKIVVLRTRSSIPQISTSSFTRIQVLETRAVFREVSDWASCRELTSTLRSVFVMSRTYHGARVWDRSVNLSSKLRKKIYREKHHLILSLLSWMYTSLQRTSMWTSVRDKRHELCTLSLDADISVRHRDFFSPSERNAVDESSWSRWRFHEIGARVIEYWQSHSLTKSKRKRTSASFLDQEPSKLLKNSVG